MSFTAAVGAGAIVAFGLGMVFDNVGLTGLGLALTYYGVNGA